MPAPAETSAAVASEIPAVSETRAVASAPPTLPRPPLTPSEMALAPDPAALGMMMGSVLPPLPLSLPLLPLLAEVVTMRDGRFAKTWLSSVIDLDASSAYEVGYGLWRL
jgi:hypothetical protein